MPDPLDMIDQIAQRQPAQQTRTRRRRNPRIRETQPEAERTDREDVQSAVGESLAGALPQLESAFDTIDRPDPIDTEESLQESDWPEDPEYRAEHRSWDPTDIPRRDPYRTSFRNEAAQDEWDDRADTNSVGAIDPSDQIPEPGTPAGDSPLKDYERQSYALQMPRMGMRDQRSPYELRLGGTPIDDELADEDGGSDGGQSPMMSVDDAFPAPDPWELSPPEYGGPRLQPESGSLDFNPDPRFSVEATIPYRSDDEMLAASADGPEAAAEQADATQPIDAIDEEEPRRGYTTDELIAMRSGERRDRIVRGVQAGLQGLGGLFQAIGGGVGNMGLASAGGGMAQGAAELPEANAYETAKTAADERLTNEAEQDIRDRQLTINEQNAESGRRNAAATQQREQRILESREAEDARHNDPAHPAAQAARERFTSLLESYGPAVGDWSDVVETLPQLGAEQIQQNIDDLENRARLGLVRRRGRGGGGGGGGGRASLAPPAPGQPDLLVEEIMAQNPNRDRAWAEQAASDIRNAPNAGLRGIAQIIAGIGTVSGEARRDDDLSAAAEPIPGWVSISGQPLPQPVLRQAFETNRNAEMVYPLMRENERLAREVRADVAARRAVGVDDPRVQKARANSLLIQATLYQMGGLGAPTGGEFERVAQSTPIIGSVDGLVNGESAYAQLRGTLRTAVVGYMRGIGLQLAPRRGQ